MEPASIASSRRPTWVEPRSRSTRLSPTTAPPASSAASRCPTPGRARSPSPAARTGNSLALSIPTAWRRWRRRTVPARWSASQDGIPRPRRSCTTRSPNWADSSVRRHGLRGIRLRATRPSSHRSAACSCTRRRRRSLTGRARPTASTVSSCASRTPRERRRPRGATFPAVRRKCSRDRARTSATPRSSPTTDLIS